MWNRLEAATWQVKVRLEGYVEKGVGQASQRMAASSEVFERAMGERLYPGTLNVRIKRKVPLREHFRIYGKETGDPNQDLLVEVCRINGILGYRICPYYVDSGLGGHGEDVLEIACSQRIPNVTYGSRVVVGLFWEDSES